MTVEEIKKHIAGLQSATDRAIWEVALQLAEINLHLRSMTAVEDNDGALRVDIRTGGYFDTTV